MALRTGWRSARELGVLAAMVVGLGIVMFGGGKRMILSSSPPTSVGEVVSSNNAFALDLYGRLHGGQGNLFFSPYSLSTALAMTSTGAKGETARQIAQTFHFDLAPDRLHPAFERLIDHINGKDQARRPYQLDTANALWGDRQDTFLPAFLKLTQDHYGAGLHQVDFRHDHERARLEINAWVEKQTRDKIKDLLSSGDVTPTTSLVLTNAIYFKGDWVTPFQEILTEKNGSFLGPNGKKIPTPLMHLTHQLAYAEDETAQVLEMPYTGDNLSMLVVLPRKPEGLADVEAKLNVASLDTKLAALRNQKVAVTFPKFKLTESIRLSSLLAQMGMTDAFDPNKADFSGMNGKRDLLISEVVHKAFVDVNEKGTEAAAATGVVMTRAMAVRPEPIVEFRADHPFLFFIRDRSTGSILFLGRVVDPSPKG